MERVKQLAGHFKPTGLAALERRSPNDVVITMVIRSPICKAFKGGYKDAKTDELMLEMYKHSIAQSKIDPKLVEDICVGSVLTPDPVYHARAAALAAGYPDTTTVQVINRFCSSGLMAMTTIANQITTGMIEIGLAVGVESMTENPDKGSPQQSELIGSHSAACDCTMRMGWTSENVAGDFKITREEQDAYSAGTYQRAERAQKLGYFKKETVPFTVFRKDPKTGEKQQVTVTEDDGIRQGVTKESLAQIRPAFPQWGKPEATTTAGNASQVSDGAAAALLMTRRKAEELGLEILGRYVTTSLAGLPPRIMGIGPVFAIPKVLEATGLTVNDVDLFEINEAFASQCVYCLKALKLPAEKLRATGIRQVATGLNELHRRKGKILLTSMCIGTGMGAAAIFLRE